MIYSKNRRQKEIANLIVFVQNLWRWPNFLAPFIFPSCRHLHILDAV